MFQYFKEIRELKKRRLQLETGLLEKFHHLTEELLSASEKAQQAGISTQEAMELLKKLQGVDQKDIVREIVNGIR